MEPFCYQVAVLRPHQLYAASFYLHIHKTSNTGCQEVSLEHKAATTLLGHSLGHSDD